MLDRAAWHELKLTVDGADFKAWLDGAARARVHARQRAGAGPQQRAAEPRPVPREQPGAASRRSRDGRPVVEDRQHQLFQGLRREPQVGAERARFNAVKSRLSFVRILVPALLFGAPQAHRAVAEHRFPRSRPSSIRPAPSSTTPGSPSLNNADRRDARDHVRDATASATVSALPLTGGYTVSVAKAGLHRRRCDRSRPARRRDRDRQDAARRHRRQDPRSPSTARNKGVRADAQIGRRMDSPDDRRNADPRPQDRQPAAVQLGIPPGQGHGRPVRQRHLLHHRRRQPPHDDVHARRREQRRELGPPDDDRHGAGRRGPGSVGPVQRLLRRVRLDGRARVEHRDQVRHERAARRGSLPGAAGRHAGQGLLDRRLLPAVGRELHHADDAGRDQSRRRAGRAEPVLRVDRRADR